MNKKIFKKTFFPFLSFLSFPFLLAFHYIDRNDKKEDSIITLTYKNDKLNLSFSYYNFFETLTESTANDFSNFENLLKDFNQGKQPSFSDDSPGLYDPQKPLNDQFVQYISGISNLLGRIRNQKQTSSMSLINYIYPKGDEMLPWNKSEILANIPLALPQTFIDKLASEKGDYCFKKSNWPTFTKDFTLSKNVGQFNFLVLLDQEENSMLPYIEKNSDIFSENGKAKLENAVAGTYRMDLDRGHPDINISVYGNLTNFELSTDTQGTPLTPGRFTFDNPNGDNDLSVIPIIFGVISLILSVSLFYPTINYLRNKI